MFEPQTLSRPLSANATFAGHNGFNTGDRDAISWPDPQVAGRSSAVTVSIVIVSRDRPAELAKTLNAVLSQKTARKVSVLIVDSSAEPDGTSFIAASLKNVVVIKSAVNLGGAGAFALGLLSAMASGAEWIWLMDDDGRPLDDDVLETLLTTASAHRLQAVAPAVIDAADPGLFAFPYPIGRRYVFRRDELPETTILMSTAHLFNGLLIKSAAVFDIGLPDLRMFIRGDEIDFMNRMRRAGVRFATTTAAAFCHPSSNNELHPIWGGRLHVVYPTSGWKRRFQYRNRAYNFLRHKMWLLMAVDTLRYPYFFLILRRGDFAGFREWLACSWAGLRGRFSAEPEIERGPLHQRNLS